MTFLVVATDGSTAMAVTDESGRVLFRGVRAGEHVMVAVYGEQSGQSTVDVVPGEENRRGFLFERIDGEVIRIEDRVGPSRAAEPKLKTRVRQLESPPEAIDRNSHGLVWVMVDVNVAGAVTQATVIKAPRGLGLEPIALKAARKLRFDPARNHAGVAIPFSLLVVFEWPPDWAKAGERGSAGACAGEGPLALDLGDNHSVEYVDCSPPPGFERVALYSHGRRLSPPRDYARQFKYTRARPPISEVGTPIKPDPVPQYGNTSTFRYVD